MNIFVAAKLVPDDQDIQVAADRSLDYSKAKPVVSVYDLNAIEAAAQLAKANDGSTVKVVSVGPKSIDDSKLKKNLLITDLTRAGQSFIPGGNDTIEAGDSILVVTTQTGLYRIRDIFQ